LRWRTPQPASPWSGTLVADKFGAICAQPDPLGGNSIFTRLFFIPIEPRSEDCLYLNVWTAASPGDKRPVMVWIPGGGFRGGSAAGAIYDGAALAKRRRARVFQLPPLEVRFLRFELSKNLNTRSPAITDCSTRSQRCAG
jgi:carboxylesterase type B